MLQKSNIIIGPIKSYYHLYFIHIYHLDLLLLKSLLFIDLFIITILIEQNLTELAQEVSGKEA